jgi:hypothetical protein
MVTRFRVILDAHDRHLECFCHYGVQVEGWLKGELLRFFDNEITDSRLVDFDREVLCGAGRKKVDYLLVLPSGIIALKVWVELKHWQIGYQKNQLWQAHNYFGDKDIGIYSDVEKLSSIIDDDKYILILATKNPGYEDWSRGVDKFNEKFKPLRVRSCTETSDFPQSYYIGVLEVVT